MSKPSNIQENSERARQNPKIISILDALTFDEANLAAYSSIRENRRIMPFWREMMIIRIGSNGHKFVYWGSMLSEYFGKDLTGRKYESELYGEDAGILTRILMQVQENRIINYSHGNLYDRNGKYINWDAVSIPVLKNEGCDHVARFIIHDV